MAARASANSGGSAPRAINAMVALYGTMAGVLARLLLFEPDAGIIDTIIGADVLLPDASFRNRDMTRGMSLLTSFAAAWNPEMIPLLCDDYTLLFIGLERTAAPPFESVYRSEEHLLFDRETAEVREHYRRYGMTAPERNRIPDDHIGYELQFLAELCTRIVTAIEEGKMDSVRRHAEEARDFIEEHLSVWMPDFIRRVEEHARTPFYPGIVLMASGVSAEVAGMMAAILGESTAE